MMVLGWGGREGRSLYSPSFVRAAQPSQPLGSFDELLGRHAHRVALSCRPSMASSVSAGSIHHGTRVGTQRPEDRFSAKPGWLETGHDVQAAHYLIGVIVARGTCWDAPKATTGNGCRQAQEP